MLNKWLENEPKETLICAVASAVSLVLSITGALKGILPFDIAWIAIILCGIPILVGAFKGVIFEHDIKADLLVSLALIASAATGEFFAAGEVALIMQIGSLLEDYTSGKARESIEKLIKITPQTARVLRDGISMLFGRVNRRAGFIIVRRNTVTSGYCTLMHSSQTFVRHTSGLFLKRESTWANDSGSGSPSKYTNSASVILLRLY